MPGSAAFESGARGSARGQFRGGCRFRPAESRTSRIEEDASGRPCGRVRHFPAPHSQRLDWGAGNWLWWRGTNGIDGGSPEGGAEPAADGEGSGVVWVLGSVSVSDSRTDRKTDVSGEEQGEVIDSVEAVGTEGREPGSFLE